MLTLPPAAGQLIQQRSTQDMPNRSKKELAYVRKFVKQYWMSCIAFLIASLLLLPLSLPVYFSSVVAIAVASYVLWRFLFIAPDPIIRFLDEIHRPNREDYCISITTDSKTPLDSPIVTLIRAEPPLRHLGRNYEQPIPLCSQGLAPFLDCDAPLRFFLARKHACIGCWELQTPTKSLEFDTPNTPCRLLIRARADDVTQDRWFLMEPDEGLGLKFSALPENPASTISHLPHDGQAQ